MESNPSHLEDESYLDLVFDDLLRRWADGNEVSVDELIAERPYLRDAIAELMAEAREIAPIRPEVRPLVPGYEVGPVLGRGGMGVVYRARQVELGRDIALKVLPAGALQSERSRQRFLSEARGLARIRHPHVVTIHEVIASDEQYAFAMELVDGRGLDRLIEQPPTDSVAFFCGIAAQIARALGEVHRQGLVHRDVKPSNILIRDDGTALLSDFGLVRDEVGPSLTRTQQFLGTAAYASPEQLRGESVGPASDLYSLGVTLYHALAGRPPFQGRSVAERLRAAESLPPRLAKRGIPRDLDAILAKCLEPNACDRYFDAQALLEDLESLLALRPVKAQSPGWISRSIRAVRRNRRTLLAVAGGATLVLVASLLVGIWAWRTVTRPERVQRLLRLARLELLEPRHEARLTNLRLQRGGQEPSQLLGGDRVERALRHYDALLEEAKARQDLLLEREVVVLARSLFESTSYQPSRLLQDRCPQTMAAWKGLAAGGPAERNPSLRMTSRTDRRALGLLAFLLGDTTLCHSAWSALDLRSEQDPLVDAAAGQLHHEAGRAALAYPRLQRAFDAFVDVGFLAYAIADCACELGDLDTAEHYLELAETLPLEDPWGRHRCVRANLLAARGDWDQAQEIYEELLRDTPASSTRRHYLRRLGQTGSSRDLERAVEIALEEVRFDAASPGSIRCLAEVADRWWSRLDLSARILEVRTALGEPVPAGSLLVQVRHTLKRSLGEKNLQNGTLPSGDLASDLQSAPVGRESFLLEVLDMNWQTYPLQALPTAIQRLVARISVAADLLPRDARHEPGFALARGLLRPVVVGAALVAAMLQGTEAVGQKDWYQRDLSGPEPGGRLGNGLAYDSARGVMVMFGGWTVAAGYMNDTWEYDGCRWKNITTAHSPSPRRPDYSFAYDSSRGVIVTFGGQDDDTLGETWEYDGVDWVQRTPPTSPHDRSNSAMVYDEARDRMVLFGGLWSGIGGLGDTWEWDGATWTDVSDIIHPAPRRAHNMVYDSARGVTVLFGGYDGSTVFGDTWEWGGTSWQLRSPAQSPSIRVQPGLAYDPTIQRVVLSGGHYPSDIDDHWEWDGTHWIQQPYSVTTRGASLCAMDYDTRLQKVVLFGASSTNNFGVPGPMGGTVELFTPTAPQVTSFGSGCTGSQGNTPVLSITSGCDPVLCGSLSVSITNLVSAGAMAALMVDLPHLETGRPSMGAFGSSPWPYLCDLSITPDRIVLLNKSGGVATWSRAIPEDLVFIGERYLLQAGDIDPAAGGIALSNALDVRIGNE